MTEVMDMLFNDMLTNRARSRTACLVAGMVLCCGCGKLFAKEVSHDVEVTEQGGVFRINAAIVVDAPADYVRQVLSDFVHIYRLNPSIIESEVLASEDDSVTHVRTRVLGCAGYFCQELERVEKVRTLPSGDLIADILPEKSEFRSGSTRWHIEPKGERSRVVYESSMEPDFYIPPVVGKFMAKKSIRTELASSFENLERIANVLADRDWKADFMLSSRRVVPYTPCELAAR